MLRTAANRAGCVFWSASESRSFVSPNNAQDDRWLPQVASPRPSPAPPQAPPTQRYKPTWPALMVAAWHWLQSWLPFLRPSTADANQALAPASTSRSSADATSAPTPAPAPQPAGVPASEGRSARALAATQIASHPIAWETDTDTDTSDTEVEPVAQDPAALIADICRSGKDVPPLAAPRTPPAGLRVGFRFTRNIAAPMHTIAQVICDSARGLEWIDRCVESRLLVATSTGPIAYHRYKLPLVGDRDSVTRSTLEAIDPDTLKITVQPWERSDVELPQNTVRLPWVEGSFTLVAQTPASTSVCHASQLLLGGGIPGFLAPMIRKLQGKSPDITLRRLAMLVESDPTTNQA